ncbi:hypothetical protein EIN_487920 [Entamoeba invadens IP1]|uniref:Uncharacterized protein n=1 Tax=Entamoeba invadens IP1 TaxID=370355 RepID=A0A0A1U8B3_ENTIV|nr:hypothetical protein EIN_487920 [Entamoeba invadens IP1]ELP89280.1 hypothetical protein EIN_487920 [Entamoeba invadens IP1]|eukprot:XP_004256051.1 hypothetical protein EIN_487920 [Entamoeba invadens IP1]
MSDTSEARFFKSKYDYKNFETYQQMFLLGLLNTRCSFTLKKQRKQTTISETTPLLKTLNFGNETIDFIQLTDVLSRPQLEQEYRKGINKQTAFRRYEKNKRVITINTLYDICLELGFFFDSKLARKSKKTKRIDRILCVFFNGTFIFTQEELIQMGDKINIYIVEKMKNGTEITIDKNDTTIYQILSNKLPSAISFHLNRSLPSISLLFLKYVPSNKYDWYYFIPNKNLFNEKVTETDELKIGNFKATFKCCFRFKFPTSLS